MKSVNVAVSNSIRRDYAVQAIPKLTVEWNMNRYFTAVADNIPAEDTDGFDSELFPIESVIEPIRPTKGILKARIDESMISDFEATANSRYYIADEDDVYKYWTSPQATNSSGVFPNHTDAVTVVRPNIIYSQNISVNKIVIKMENFWASPNSFFIKVQDTSGGPWNTVSTSPTIANDGSVTLYWNGTAWTTTVPSLISPALKSIRGIMVQVASMTAGRDANGAVSKFKVSRGGMVKNGVVIVPPSTDDTLVSTDGKFSYFNLIEISARREEDLSDRLISVNDNFDIADISELYPIGTLTSNVADITLSNLYTSGGNLMTGYFSENNASSPYVGILDANARFVLSYVYTVAGVDYPVQQFEMFNDEWPSQISDEINISLTDRSKFLEDMYPTPVMYENLTVPEIFQKLLDSVGFTDWVVTTNANVVNTTIPVFWVDGEQNIWEILDELAKGTQTAIYFDGLGKLQIKTRQAAFNNAASTVWTLRAEPNGVELPDIIEATEDSQLGTNTITISYQTTKWDKLNRGTPAMQKVWEPEDTVTLRASALTKSMGSTHQFIWIDPADVKIWPYEGIVQIEGELIKYKGKSYVYYTGASGNTANTVTLNSADDKIKYDAMTSFLYKHKNHFDGGLFIPIIDGSRDNARGYWNSEKKDHNVDLQAYSVRRANYSGGSVSNNTDTPGLKHNKAQSTVTVTSAGNASGEDLTIATIGNIADTGFKWYGTRMRLLKGEGMSDQRAGIMFHNNNTNDGYFVELKATSKIAGAERANRDELVLFTQNNDKSKKLGGNGAEVAVAEGIWYDIDIFVKDGATQDIMVYLNGRRHQTVSVPAGADQHAANGKFGIFVRGKSQAEFEYLYAIKRNEAALEDDSTYFNLIDGGYTGSFWDREWVFGWKSRKKRKKKKSTKQWFRWNQFFFDEFGPIVHEVREYEVKFDPAPVQHSRLYLTNEWSAICTEYRSSPFGAYFILANTSRRNEVINGEDNVTLGGDRTINQILTVIGRVLVFGDEETVVSKNATAIRIRGKVEAELSSPWIQTKEAAQNIADWINTHWAIGLDQLNVKIFGNTLLEIGDVVGIEYPIRNMTATTHKYYITSIQSSFEEGIETTVGLRRVI